MATVSDRDLAIIVPVLGRPQRLHIMHRNVWSATPYARLLFVVSPDDEATIERAKLFDLDYIVVDWPGGSRGDYARKINAGYRATTQPLLFTGADDLDFHRGWFAKAAALIDLPDEVVQVMHGGTGGVLIGPGHVPRIGVVGTRDLCNPRVERGEHSTHSLVARWYADQGGSAEQGAMIYHEGYWHEYCDDELIATAVARGAYAHAHDAVVEHLHPNVRKARMDSTYELGRAHTRESRVLFLKRQRLWGAR